MTQTHKPTEHWNISIQIPINVENINDRLDEQRKGSNKLVLHYRYIYRRSSVF